MVVEIVDKQFIKKLVYSGIAVVIVVFIITLMIDKQNTSEIISGILNTISPFIYGLAIAYVLNPLYKRLYNLVLKIDTKKKLDNHPRINRAIEITCIFLSESILIGLIALVIFSVIPSLVESLTAIADTLPKNMQYYMDNIDEILNKYKWLKPILGKDSSAAVTKIQDFLVNDLEYNLDFASKVLVDFVSNTISYTLNIIVAIIASAMLLINKEPMLKSMNRLIRAMSGKYSNIVFEELNVANNKFSGFFVGKIVDSVIIGFIAAIVLLIMGVKYTALIAFIIGITNIIPIIGPFIGAIPSAIIVFNQSPKLSLYFIIFILILQQIDGNIIGPKCIGNSTNINSFWILFSLIVFGKLWGIVGMVIGVPMFAVIYDIIEKVVDHKLNKETSEITSNKVEEQ